MFLFLLKFLRNHLTRKKIKIKKTHNILPLRLSNTPKKVILTIIIKIISKQITSISTNSSRYSKNITTSLIFFKQQIIIFLFCCFY